MSQRLHLKSIEKAQREIARRMPLMQNAKMRQRYHFMALTGWINIFSSISTAPIDWNYRTHPTRESAFSARFLWPCRRR